MKWVVKSSEDLFQRLIAISDCLFHLLHRCYPCSGVFSDGLCGAPLISDCAADFQVFNILTTEYVETEYTALEFD